MARSSRRGRAVAAVITGLVSGGGMFAMFAASAPSAFADSSPYELYCPGTPVGNIVLNGVVTAGTITPAAPAAGSTFNLTNYSSVVTLPSSIAAAAQALGNSSISGTAVTKVDATGATPASISSGNLTISAPLPSPIPTTGITLNLPATPATIGPFTATGGAISLTVDPAISLGLVVSGSTLNLTCKPYPNNTAATGIVSTAPAGSPAAPVISSGTAGGSSTPPPTTAATTPTATTPTTAATTPAPTPSTSSLASTGPGPHLWLVAVIGFIVLYLGSVVLALVERPRSLLRRVLRLAPPAIPVPAGVVEAAEAAPMVDRSVWSTPPPSAKPAYPKAGGSPGLWFDGWEPQGRKN
jgi:hypothetical protein